MELATKSYQRRRFTADEVMRMVETGVLYHGERVELIAGELLVMNPQGATHSSLTVHLHRVLQRAYGSAHHVRDHSPVVGTTDSIPEPDLAVVPGEPLALSSRQGRPSGLLDRRCGRPPPRSAHGAAGGRRVRNNGAHH